MMDGYCAKCDTVWASPGRCKCEPYVKMTPKDLAFKEIASRIDNISQLAMEGIELVYKAAYNEAIEDAAKECDMNSDWLAVKIRKLKK